MTVEEKENEINNYRKTISALADLIPFEYDQNEFIYESYKYRDETSYNLYRSKHIRRIEHGLIILGYKSGVDIFVQEILDLYNKYDWVFGKTNGGFYWGWIKVRCIFDLYEKYFFQDDLPSHARVYFRIGSHISYLNTTTNNFNLKNVIQLFYSIEEFEILTNAFINYCFANYYYEKRKICSDNNKVLLTSLVVNYSINCILSIHNFIGALINSCAYEFIQYNLDSNQNTEIKKYLHETKNIKDGFKKLLKIMGKKSIENIETEMPKYNDSKKFRNSLTHFNPDYKNSTFKKSIRKDYEEYLEEMNDAIYICLEVGLKFWQLYKSNNSTPDYLFDLEKSKLEEHFKKMIFDENINYLRNILKM